MSLSSWWRSRPRQQKKTLVGILAISGVLILWDIYLALNPVPGDTISATLSERAWAAGLIGFVVGHIFFSREFVPSESEMPRWVAVPAGILSGGFGTVIENSLVSFAFGCFLGTFFWRNATLKEGGL